MQRNYLCAKWPALFLAALAGMAAAHAQTATLAAVQRTVVSHPVGVGLATDAAGNIYYSRQDNATDATVVKLTPDGTSTSLIGPLNYINGIAIDTSGNVYALDNGHGKVVRAGSSGTQVVASGFSQGAWGLAVDRAGNIYVSQPQSKNVVKQAPDGSRTVFENWDFPTGLATDQSGNLYVADQTAETIVRIAPDGSRTAIAGSFSGPSGVAVDASGNIFVADSGSDQVVKIAPSGTRTILLSGVNARNVAVGVGGNLLVADSDGNRIVALMQSANAGTANVCASGQNAPQPCSQALTLTFAVTSGGTMGVPQVLADGAPNSDFNITGSTCSGAVAAGTCDVNVSFNPLTPGLRRGAVQLTDGNGNAVAAGLLFGTGVAPRIGFGMGAATTITSNVAASQGLAVDGHGNLFSSAYSTVVRIANGKAATFASGLNGPQAIAVDGAGNLYVADAQNGRIAKVPASGAVAGLIGGLGQPSGVAVDGDGNVYVADRFLNSLTKYTPDGGSTTLSTALASPSSVALDAAGNVYVADTANNRIVKIAADGSLSAIGSTWLNPRSVVVDAAGNVIASDAEKIVRVAPDGTQTVLLSGSNITAIALDGAGTLYVSQNAVITKYQRTAPPSLTFPQTQTGVLSATQTVILENIGNAPMYTSAAADPSFPLSPGSGIPADCDSNSLVQPGQSCALTVGFRPSLAGSIAGAVAVSSNSLNANYQTDSISLAGQGLISSQTITFGPILDQHAGDTLALSASASSGLAITYTSLTPAVCSVSGSTATLLASGACSIQASQAGNGGYTAAAPVAQSFNVALKTQAITFAQIAPQSVGGTLTFAASSDSGLAVSFASTTPTICSVSGTTATMLAAGTCSIQASQTGNAQYAAAAPVTQSFNVMSKTQTLSFAQIAPQTVGGTLSLTASSDSGLAVSFASTTPTVCSVSGTTATLLAAGTCTIQASQAGNAQYAAAAPVTQSFNVGLKSQTITFGAIPAQSVGGTLSLTASSTSGLAVSFASSTPAICSVSGTTATLLAAGTCTIQASQVGNSQYAAAAPVTQSFNVGLKSQTITFGAIPAQSVGGTLSLTASSTSGLAVSFASSTPAICSVSGTSATMLAAGTCTIQASQAGNAQYAAAAPVTQSFSVNANAQADFTITPLPSVQNVVLGDVTAFVLQLRSVQNFNGNVTLSCSGGPAGSKCADLPQTVRVNGTALALSGILFPKGTPKGTYTMSFTGVSGALKHTATAQFVVK